MKHLTYALLPALVVMVWLASASPIAGDTTTPCPPTTVTHVPRWHKVASRTDDYWPDGYHIILTPEPGMPQALGYATWQALYEDIRSLDGSVTDVGLWYDSNFGSEANNNFVSYPAGLVPAGRPHMNSTNRWMYFTHAKHSLSSATQAYVRFQGVDGHVGPVMRLEIGVHGRGDPEFALYVKK